MRKLGSRDEDRQLSSVQEPVEGITLTLSRHHDCDLPIFVKTSGYNGLVNERVRSCSLSSIKRSSTAHSRQTEWIGKMICSWEKQQPLKARVIFQLVGNDSMILVEQFRDNNLVLSLSRCEW
jgi:hypothetical protein